MNVTGELQLYLVRLTASLGAVLDVLDDDERKRAGRLVRPFSARQFAGSRAALRVILGNHLGVSATDVRLGRRQCLHCGLPHGKPAVIGETLEFNVSHAGTYALIALSGRVGVGVDLELQTVKRDCKRIAERHFTRAEQEWLFSSDDPQLLSYRFGQLWTRKEAVLKCTGEGLLGGLETLSVQGADPSRIVHRSERGAYIRVTDVPICGSDGPLVAAVACSANVVSFHSSVFQISSDDPADVSREVQRTPVGSQLATELDTTGGGDLMQQMLNHESRQAIRQRPKGGQHDHKQRTEIYNRLDFARCGPPDPHGVVETVRTPHPGM